MNDADRDSDDDDSVPGPVAPLSAAAPGSMVATLPSGSDEIQKAVAAVPFFGSRGEACGVPFPSLTVEQYVSLRAALLVSPGESEAVLRRYGVLTPASHRALHTH